MMLSYITKIVIVNVPPFTPLPNMPAVFTRQLVWMRLATGPNKNIDPLSRLLLVSVTRSHRRRPERSSLLWRNRFIALPLLTVSLFYAKSCQTIKPSRIYTERCYRMPFLARVTPLKSTCNLDKIIGH